MSVYRDRPWLGLYQAGKPADIAPSHGDALAMWRGGAGSAEGARRPFLFYFDTPLTGADVDADSDALAVALATRGLGRGDRIALFLQNVPQFVITLLAAWKLGAIAVPVNPMLKERELRYVLADSGTMTIGDLAEVINRSPSATSRLVDGLVRRRLVERRVEEEDRRQRTLQLTPRGAALLRVVDRARADQFLSAVRPLPTAERALIAMGVAALATHAISRRGRLIKNRVE